VREPTAGVVLAGGRSARMGSPKAALEWHGSTLLRRAVGIVGRVVDGPVIVVTAPEQELPALPAGLEVAEDAREGRGPLQGIAAALKQVGERADVVFVTGVDTPLLHPAFVRHVLGSLRRDDDVALPRAHGFAHALAAAYRRATTAPQLDAQLARGQLATGPLLALLRVRELDEDALLADPGVAELDPRLQSLLNLNTRGEYASARARRAPRVAVTTAPDSPPRTVEAATLGAAANAAGIALGTGVVASLAGHGTVCDPHEPLVEGDSLNFRAPSS
jgi:molybdopterin-guanine dinucleotide biosynthesis protein A